MIRNAGDDPSGDDTSCKFEEKKEEKSKSNTGLIVGICVGVVSFLVIVGIIIAFVVTNKKSSSTSTYESEINGDDYYSQQQQHLQAQRQSYQSIDYNIQNQPTFPQPIPADQFQGVVAQPFTVPQQ